MTTAPEQRVESPFKFHPPLETLLSKYTRVYGLEDTMCTHKRGPPATESGEKCHPGGTLILIRGRNMRCLTLSCYSLRGLCRVRDWVKTGQP